MIKGLSSSSSSRPEKHNQHNNSTFKGSTFWWEKSTWKMFMTTVSDDIATLWRNLELCCSSGFGEKAPSSFFYFLTELCWVTKHTGLLQKILLQWSLKIWPTKPKTGWKIMTSIWFSFGRSGINLVSFQGIWSRFSKCHFWSTLIHSDIIWFVCLNWGRFWSILRLNQQLKLQFQF